MSRSLAFVLERIEQAINHVLHYDPDSRAALAELAGRVIAVEVSEPALQLYLLPGADGLQISNTAPGDVDVTIAGRPLALLGMVTRRDASQGHVEIRGDIHLAQRLQQILRQLDIDWEEMLAQRLGDVAAHRLGHLGRRLRQRLQILAGSLHDQFSDYLQHEQRFLPLRHEIDEFSEAVDELRDAVERAEQRLVRLERRRGGRS